MRIRFLQTTPSDVEGYPFQAGQIIVVPTLTAEMRAWLKTERAVLLREEGAHDELALAGVGPERAVTRTKKSRRG